MMTVGAKKGFNRNEGEEEVRREEGRGLEEVGRRLEGDWKGAHGREEKVNR